jgi:TRAP-type C4-dicarboxylate transport system permease small subunit
MRTGYRRAMDAIYLFCMLIAGLSLVIMTLVIPWGVYTRYVLNRGSAWPEPMAVLLVILFTFFAGAACYRAGVHISVGLFADSLSERWRRSVILLSEALMALLAVFMLVWGIQLVDTTWRQVIAEFPFLSVGVTYLPIPVSAAFTLLFIGERLWIGLPPRNSMVYREPVEAN